MRSIRFRFLSFTRGIAGGILLLAITLPAWAEWKSIGPIAAGQGSVTTLPNGAEIRAGTARIKITALRDSVIRVQVSPPSTPSAARTPGRPSGRSTTGAQDGRRTAGGATRT